MAAGTILALDTSALLCRYIPDRRRDFVLGEMAAAQHWVASALVRTEVLLALHEVFGQTMDASAARTSPWSIVGHDWANIWEIPLDARCVHRAAEIGAKYSLGINAALHLAALDRIPRPLVFLSFDQEQLSAAIDMNFDIAYQEPN